MRRAAQIKVEIIEGTDVLAQGHETARILWNEIWWSQIGHNDKLRRERGDDWERYRRNLPHNRGERYLGNFGIQKEIKDFWAAKHLSDRCFSYTVKDFDIAMKSWFSNLKQNPKARPPRYSKLPRTLTFEVGRNAKPVGDMRYQLTVLGGRRGRRTATIRLMIKPGVKMASIKMLRLKPNGSGSAILMTDVKPSPGDGLAAVDLGIVNFATIAFDSGESIMVSGKALVSAQQWGQKRAAKCKPKNWAKGKAESHQSERFKRYRRKAGNIQKLATHNLTRFITDECIRRKVGTLVIGDLKGIREDADHGKAGNQRLHNWPFGEFRRQIEYKAEEVGIEVLIVSERGTSKHCHICGNVGVRNPRGLLKCKHCQVIIHSDVNGAFGILNKVSPSPVVSGVGVAANFPGLPSPSAVTGRAGEAREPFSQIHPTFVATFDLRNWAIVQP